MFGSFYTASKRQTVKEVTPGMHALTVSYVGDRKIFLQLCRKIHHSIK